MKKKMISLFKVNHNNFPHDSGKCQKPPILLLMTLHLLRF